MNDMGSPRHPRIRMSTVGEVLDQTMPGKAYLVALGANVFDVLQVMAEHDVGAVLVFDGERMAGIFSERDFAREVLHHLNWTDVPVQTMMTKCTTHATRDDTVDRCLALMTEKGLCHLPVMENDEAIGMLSQETLLRALVDHHTRVFQAAELDHRIMFLRGTYSC